MNRAIQRRRKRNSLGVMIHGVEWIQDGIWKAKWFKDWKAREDFIQDLEAANMNQPDTNAVEDPKKERKRYGKL